MEFHERLAHLCQTRRFRRSDIVEALNEPGDPRLATSKATVGRWFSGQSEPSIQQLCYLSRRLGTTIEAFCPGSGEEVPAEPDGARSLGPDELLVMTLCRQLGFERALRRLLAMDAESQ